MFIAYGIDPPLNLLLWKYHSNFSTPPPVKPYLYLKSNA